MVSGGEHILNIIKLTTEYDISTTSNIILRAKTEMITERPDNNLITILEDRVSNSELSNVPKDFKNIAVNNNDIKELQSKKRKRNKYHYTKNITHDFQSNIASNKKINIIKYI